MSRPLPLMGLLALLCPLAAPAQLANPTPASAQAETSPTAATATVAPVPAMTLGEMQAKLDALFDQDKYSNAFWGVRIENGNGEALYERFAEKGMVPASNMKVFTSAAALALLGPDYKYTTNVFAVGEVTTGTLKGDLLIVGSGDPSLGAWHPDREKNSQQVFDAWIADLRKAGITKIEGDIIGDGRYFTEDYIHPDWEYSDLAFWYAAGTSGLAMEENAFRILIEPGAKEGDPAKLTLTPDTKYVTLINKVKTGAANGPNNADATHRSTDNEFLYERSVALGKVVNERGSILDGERYAAFLFQEALERAGITVTGKAYNIRALDAKRVAALDKAKEGAKPVTFTISPPLREQVKVINGPSHNFFADQILRTVGAEKGKGGSFEGGVSAIEDWLKEIGVPAVEQLQMKDGSGLSRSNLVQPRHMAALLNHMASPAAGEAGKAFYESLPVGGATGTLASRLNDPIVKGRVHAKTGFIGNMRALSGYIAPKAEAGPDAKHFVFSMMCNRYTIPTGQVNDTQDEACRIIAMFMDGVSE